MISQTFILKQNLIIRTFYNNLELCVTTDLNSFIIISVNLKINSFENKHTYTFSEIDICSDGSMVQWLERSCIRIPPLLVRNTAEIMHLKYKHFDAEVEWERIKKHDLIV